MAQGYKANISFGLVYIPVRLTAAAREEDIRFHQLHKGCGGRIQYKKICSKCGEEVGKEDIEKGYEYSKGHYVAFTEEELKKLQPARDQSISIQQFVGLEEILPVYYNRTFFLEPDGAGRAFALLYHALEKANKAGIAKAILNGQETLVALYAAHGMLLLATLFYASEIREGARVEGSEPTAAEKKLALQLIDSLSSPFLPEEYKHEKQERMEKAIETKLKGKKIIAEKPARKPAEIINLQEALQKSLRGKTNAKTKGNAPSRARATGKKKAAKKKA